MNRGKKFFTSVGLAALLLFGLTAPAHALTTLISSALFVGSGQFLVCTIVNAGPAPITVTRQVISLVGNVLTETTSTILPGDVGLLNDTGPLVGVYCKFTGNFNRGFVRANLQTTDNLATIAVVPAQAVGE
jgi:hypothetical protein